MQLHTPVLLPAVLDFAARAKGGFYLDATLGYAGHASAILHARSDFSLLGFDQDPFAREQSAAVLGKFGPRARIFSGNFRGAFAALKAAGVDPAELRFVLADIGVSSPQLDFAERGFSYESNELDMRMDPSAPLSAREVLNDYSRADLEQILTNFGQLPPRLAADIAAKITSARPISSCQQLAALIGNAPLKGRKVALKTLVFQAVRIAVNAELDALSEFLSGCERELSECILCVISFHSLEDTLVKSAFKRFASDCICDDSAMRCSCGGGHSLGRILSKKPITPSAEEVAANPRAGCAKMRVFEFFRRAR